MGRDIVNKESPNKIGKRSRLWRQKDVICTLKNDDGTPEVQGIVLDMIKINKDIHLSPQVFKKMYNLRLLKFYDSTYYDYSKVNCSEDLSDPYKPRSLIRHGYPLQAPFYNFTYSNYSKVNFLKGPSILSDKLRSLNWYGYPLHAPFYNSTSSDYSKVNFLEGLSVLSDKLRSLIWHGYPLQALPSNFNPNNLVELDLRGSNLKRLWEDCMDIPKLRWLNLSGCTRVTTIPNLSKSPLLELIDLSGCTCVIKISDLSKSPLLEMIYLQDCRSLLDIPLLAQHPKYLVYLCSRGCTSLRSFPSDIHFESLTSLDLMKRAAIKELPHSIAYLNGLEELFLGGCEDLETLPSGICNLTSLRHLDLSDCSRLEILGGNLGNLKSLKYLSVKRAAIKEIPHSIAHLNGLKELFLRRCENLETLPSGFCNLTSLQHLDLSDCSRLKILPENLGNLKYLNYLSADRIAICQLPYSVKRLKKLSSGLGFLYSFTRLFLSDCNLNYIPKDIGRLSSLVELDLSVNSFDGLPQSMRELYCLKFLHLDNCNMVVSLIDLPPNLTHLSACDCKQLQSIPNALDFVRIIKTKSKPKPTEFIFTNCMNLEETAVSNMLIHPLLKRPVKYSHKVFTSFRFCYPGRKAPKWFRYTTEGSLIKFQKTFDPNLKGFAVCAVIAFEKYLFNGDSQHKLGVHFNGTCSDGDQSSPTNIMSETAYVASRNRNYRTLIDSDHVAFGYCSSYGLREGCIKNYSFECRLSEESPNCRVKSWVVCPIYYQDSDTVDSDEAGTSGSRFDEEEMEPHPKENENLQTVKYGEPIEHNGETSGIRRSRTSNDYLEEEVEPHPKRLNI
ncbi:hypothetical protein LWI29_020016 [Acer saccharum]|uniref:Uncharacterized protein n=1 Tax=Acer saccharum TaxID=4024 RepID=A0AA39SW84_ACESA|nr:hypothetical protein LWI29_020016 [Acer saccharum]